MSTITEKLDRRTITNDNNFTGTSWKVVMENKKIIYGHIEFKAKIGPPARLVLGGIEDPDRFLRELDILTTEVVKIQEEGIPKLKL